MCRPKQVASPIVAGPHFSKTFKAPLRPIVARKRRCTTSNIDISENGPRTTHRPLGQKMDRFDPQKFVENDERVR